MNDPKEISILYVDDEEPNLFLFKTLFERKYNVLTASSGKDALEKLRFAHDQIMIVISDMSMPEMNGVEFVKKAKEKYHNIGYYILTGYGYNDEIDQALKDDVIQNFFTKPFNEKEIERAISEYKA